jgi:hypothetical protein
VAKEVCSLVASRPANAALQAASLLGVKLAAITTREARAVLQALLEVAGAA